MLNLIKNWYFIYKQDNTQKSWNSWIPAHDWQTTSSWECQRLYDIQTKISYNLQYMLYLISPTLQRSEVYTTICQSISTA